MDGIELENHQNCKLVELEVEKHCVQVNDM